MTSAAQSAPPVARKERTETTLHGVTLTDDYAWLRDKEDPDVTAYLEAENAWAEAFMAPLAPLRDQLYNEMLSHIRQTDVTVPFRDGAWWYFSRTEEGKQYATYCRMAQPKNQYPTLPPPVPPSGVSIPGEQIILDGNQLAQGHAFFAIGSTDITDDANFLVYTTDTKGFRQYTLYIKNLQTGEPLPESSSPVERVGSVSWAADNRTLFYSVEDEEQKRQFQLWRHILGTPHSEDVLVYQDDDERFNLGVGRTHDGQYLVLETASHTTAESWFLRADQPLAGFRVICPREDEHEYSIDHRN